MSSDRILSKDLIKSCSEVGENDGRDPRLDRREPPAFVKNRKALQLCAQVAETLSLVIAGELDDDLLRDLRVESVIPAPTAAQMLVTLSMADLGEEVSREVVEKRLAAVQGRLRVEVGRAIHRRRVPQLFFSLIRRAD